MIVYAPIIAYPQSMRKVLLLLATMIVLLSGCQVTEHLDIETGNSGKSYTDIHVEQFFIDVLEDFGEFLPASDESMMDNAISGYASQLDGVNAISDIEWENLGDNHYTVSFSFSGIDTLLSQLGAENQTLFALTDNSLSFHLDISNYEELKSAVPFLADPNFEVYGPEYNQGMSETDYLDMIYFLLGEDGPEAITKGIIEIAISVPGTITEASNCDITGENTVSFNFPIIDFLLLNEPLEFSVSWE